MASRTPAQRSLRPALQRQGALVCAGLAAALTLWANGRAVAQTGLPGELDLAGRLLEDDPSASHLLAPVEQARYRLPKDPLGPVSRDTTSLGTAEDGSLNEGQRLALVGRHYAVLRSQRGRKNIHWATTEVIALVEHAAAYVAARFPGTVLPVGNLSQRRGGDITYSYSHNSGRDVDLGFFLRDERGQPFPPGRYYSLGPDGRRPEGRSPRLSLDLPRMWALIEGLLSHPTVQVQWLYIHQGLAELLLAYGREHSTEPELLRRAGFVLAQPLISGAHREHLHVRVYCAPDDLLDGCRDTGPRWDWIDPYEEAFQRRLDQLLSLLRRDSDPSRRRAALRRLERVEGAEAAPELVAMLRGESAPLRLELLATIRRLGNPLAAGPLAALLAEEQDSELRVAMLDTLGALAEPGVAEALHRVLAPGCEAHPPRAGATPPAARAPEADCPPEQERQAAARSLGYLGATRAAPWLIDALDSPSPGLRRSAAAALQLLTNRAELGAEAWAAAAPARRAAARGRWASWWAEHAQESHDEWLVSGFGAAGHAVARPVAFQQAGALVAARQDRRLHVRINAEQILRRLARMAPWRPGQKLQQPGFWQMWWLRTRRQNRVAG